MTRFLGVRVPFTGDGETTSGKRVKVTYVPVKGKPVPGTTVGGGHALKGHKKKK